MSKRDNDAMAVEARQLSNRIRPLLVGRDPGVVGAALADLVSILIAGHHPDLRDKVFKMFVETAHNLIEPSAQEMASQIPPEWKKQ